MQRPLARLLSALFLSTLLAACGGGGAAGEAQQAPVEAPNPSGSVPTTPGSSAGTGQASPDTESGINTIQVSPGDYADIANCPPFVGSENAEYKLLFINLDSAPYFDDIVDDAITNQFQVLPPYSDYFSRFAFYKMPLSDSAALGCEKSDSTNAAAFSCDDEKIHQAIQQHCAVDDIEGIIKVVIAGAEFGASGGEVIYFGSDASWTDRDTALYYTKNLVIHEVSHNFGLADLYDGGTNKDGSAVTGWPSSLSRQWHNLDGPGCDKWCASAKPASEYILSANSACHTFSDRQSCVDFNRAQDGECKTDDGGSYACCAWSEDTVDDYFGSQCTPAWGTEDIGLDCLDGAGCYYGGAYGNNSWRPVKSPADSIMYSAWQAAEFDSVSRRELAEAIRCCGTADDSTASCEMFRQEYSTFLREHQPFKNRVGSCGVKPPAE
ncbi:hypothetical protein ACNKU7_13600 [Microbulbifer sp. SA54]|uniref:hypothetical protein n=1 Tax=Microbulbifer sp. SA54 TaxID=3401577 RepID=UPI003AB0929C